MADQVMLARVPARSMGLKLLLVCALAVVMAVPALFVFALLMDRTHRAEQVTREVSQLMGGSQTFLGPVIAVPYAAPAVLKDRPPERGVHLFFPVQAHADVSATSEVRKRSLFRVPVFRADLDLKGDFELPAQPANLPDGAVLDWSRAEVLVGVSDPRGAQADIQLAIGGRPAQGAPSTPMSEMAAGEGEGLRYFGAPLGGGIGPGWKVPVRARLKFAGAQRLAVLPFGKTTTFGMRSDWPDPGFDGGFLPVSRQIGAKGFAARWSVPFVARGVPAEGGRETLDRLQAGALGVSFVDPANPYQSVARSLKYALLFVGLVFLAYFLFESMARRRVHPAQYVLIGLAQVIFYLLLLSIAEQLGFDWAFLVAAAATVSLISAYAGWVFESRRQGLVALLAFSLLYGLIYILMRLEDLALLVGAVASFAAIAAVMYFTRRINWYGTPDPRSAA